MPVERTDDAADVDVNSVAERLAAVEQRIRAAERRFQRRPGEVTLLAVSKTKPAAMIAAAAAAGQRRFGENYPQEALRKIAELAELNLEWHLIGPLQSNKTRAVAEHCTWVQSVDRLKIARRLSEQRPAEAGPLNVLLQVNVDQEDSKSGFTLDELAAAAAVVAELPRLRLRGLMAIPAPRQGLSEQRQPFARLRAAFEALNGQGLALDTLSMGMSDDLEAAVAEGATMVRIGSAVFGARS